MRIIDSSVIVKYFSEEPGWEDVEVYLYEPISIRLSMMELGSALLKKVRKNELDHKKAAEILERYPETFRFIEERKHISKAFEIAKKYGTSIYDAMFIAVALKNSYGLVTCDKYQAEIARKAGIKTTEC
jgi:predicted nucleic acid-binding protein